MAGAALVRAFVVLLLLEGSWLSAWGSHNTDFFLVEMDHEHDRRALLERVQAGLSSSLCQAIPGLVSWGLDCESMGSRSVGDHRAATDAAGKSIANDFVIDWVADTGDDYMATLTVALAMAQPSLPLLELTGPTAEKQKHSSSSSATAGANNGNKPPSPIQRASRIVVGGDLMYPEPSVEGYELRFKSAFRTALDVVANEAPSIDLESVLPDDPPEAIDWFSFDRVETAILHFFYSIDSFRPPVQTHYPSVTREDPDPHNPLPPRIWQRLPTLLVAPGNHDHLDNLRAFQLAFFTENRIGGWRLGARSRRHSDKESESGEEKAADNDDVEEHEDDDEATFTWHSFSVRQGDREWVFLVVDSMYYEGDSSDIGPAQFNDLTDFVNRLSSYGSPLHLVMMMHAPFWTLHGRPGLFLQKLFRHLEELPHVALRLLLAGDMHYYARYNPVVDSLAIRHRAVETPLLVTCGLGGAFKHSTAQLLPTSSPPLAPLRPSASSPTAPTLPPATSGPSSACSGPPGTPFFLTDLLFYRLDALLHRSPAQHPAHLLANPPVVAAFYVYILVVAFLHLRQEYIAAVELAWFALAIAVPLLRIANTELHSGHDSLLSTALLCRLLFAFVVLFFLFPIILLPLFIASLCGVFTLPCGCSRQLPSPAPMSTSLSSLHSLSASSLPSSSSSPSLWSSEGRFNCRRTRSSSQTTSRVSPEALRTHCLTILCIVVVGLAVSAYEPFQTHAFSEVSAAYSRKTTHNGFIRMQIADEGRTLKVFFVSIEPLVDLDSVGASVTEPLGEGFSLRHFPLEDSWLRQNIRLHDYFILTEMNPSERNHKQDSSDSSTAV